MNDNLDLNQIEKTSKKSVMVSGLGLIVIIAALIYSFIKLGDLQKETENLSEVKENLKTEIDSLQKLKDTLSARLMVSNSANLVERQVDKVSIEQNLTDITAVAAPRVYIHISNRSQNSIAKRVATILQKNGFVVPGIENVGNKSPQVTQVRYFNNSEQEKKDVKYILGLFKKQDIRVDEQLVSLTGQSKVRPRHYEIWFGIDY